MIHKARRKKNKQYDILTWFTILILSFNLQLGITALHVVFMYRRPMPTTGAVSEAKFNRGTPYIFFRILPQTTALIDSFGKGLYDGNSWRYIGILKGSPSDKFGTVKLSSGVALTSSGQIDYKKEIVKWFSDPSLCNQDLRKLFWYWQYSVLFH